jgi:hypothetical protein
VSPTERAEEEGIKGVTMLSIPNLSELVSYLAQSSRCDSPSRSSVSMLDRTWHMFHAIQV